MPDYTLLEYICEDNREYADEQGRQQIPAQGPGHLFRSGAPLSGS